MDYFGARHYSNDLGRFITPDWSSTPVPIPYADLSDPQSLNQYGYVRNIPTSKSDPDGHECPECPAVERVLEEVAESPLGKAIAEKGGQIIGGIGTGVAAGWAWSSGAVKDLARYAAEHPGKSAAQQDMDDLSGRTVKQALAQSQQNNQDSQTNANDKSTPADPNQKGSSSTTNPTGSNQPKSNPMQGPPGGTSKTTHPDGSTKQARRYGADGYPQTDGHDHGQGDPHAHDCRRPAGGGPPTHTDRGHGRPVKPDDLK